MAKILSAGEIDEIRRRYANGATRKVLGLEYGVTSETIRIYTKDVQRVAEPLLTDIPEVSFGADTASASDCPGTPVLDAEDRQESAAEPINLYELARGFDEFIRNHVEGEFAVSVSRKSGQINITASTANQEFTLKRKEKPNYVR